MFQALAADSGGPVSMLGEIGRATPPFSNGRTRNGRKNILLISPDDGYIRARAAEPTRKLVSVTFPFIPRAQAGKCLFAVA